MRRTCFCDIVGDDFNVFFCSKRGFEIIVKSQFVAMILFLFLAILGSTFLGIAVFAAAKSQAQVTAAAGFYFLVLLLLSGFFVPLDESSFIVRSIAYLSPLTFIIYPFTGWIFGAGLDPGLPPSALALAIQTMVYGLLAMILLRHVIRSL
jgi:ABC-type multidrug transport system permease subunit